MAKKVFEGIKVLDFTSNYAGPLCTRALGRMGCDVIKIERPGSGDETRGMNPRWGEFGLAFANVNTAKKSIELDLSDPDSVALIMEMAKDADVVVESFSVGVMAKYGLDYESFCKVNPEIIYCSISAFGQTGPYAKLPGYDLIAQAYSGLMDLTGYVDGPPTKAQGVLGDEIGAINGYGAIVTALYHKKCTGEGQHIDISLYEGLVQINNNFAAAATFGGDPHRTGNHHHILVPYGVFNGTNGSVVITAPGDRLWVKLCSTIGQPELAEDERFSNAKERAARIPEIIDILETWLKTYDDIAEPTKILQDAGIPVAKVLTTKEVVADPHLLARDGVLEWPLPGDNKPYTFKGAWIKYSKTPDDPLRLPPYLGEHNYEIMEQYGWSKEKIDEKLTQWHNK